MSLRNLTRRAIDRLLLHRLSGPFGHEMGAAWVVALPQLRPHADVPSARSQSTLVLYEDGIPLLPAHSLHADIRAFGGGAYSHRQSHLLFSTRDGSDPNTNGRTYEYSLSPWLYSRRVLPALAQPGLPVNHRPREVSAAQIREEVHYALQVGRGYRDTLRRLLPSLAGATVLEIGPGSNFGAALFLGAFGARPVVADRFLSRWNAPYHPEFYAELRETLARSEPEADLRGIDAMLRANNYPKDVIGRIESPLETLPCASNSIDAVISNAVLEHVYGVPAAAAQLYRITRPGGIGLHQVDFRDHRDFDRPLEYLLLGEDDFARLFTRSHGECGNRWRGPEFHAALAQVGFEVLRFDANVFSRPEYVQQLLPRLAAAPSRYAGLRGEELHVLSGQFQLRKPAREGGGDVHR
jgi:SAM-dependent methyltransferase